MPMLDQLYNAPASVSHTFLAGTLLFILGVVAGILGYRNRNKL